MRFQHHLRVALHCVPYRIRGDSPWILQFLRKTLLGRVTGTRADRRTTAHDSFYIHIRHCMRACPRDPDRHHAQAAFRAQQRADEQATTIIIKEKAEERKTRRLTYVVKQLTNTLVKNPPIIQKL